MSKLKNKKVISNGIKFASQMECDFYDYLLLSHSAHDIIIQPKFTLQDKFTKYGILHREISYIADFQIKSTGLVYDVKGMKTIHFIIKQKLFDYKYQDLHLCLITKCPIWLQSVYGKWVDLNDLAIERKNKKLQGKK